VTHNPGKELKAMTNDNAEEAGIDNPQSSAETTAASSMPSSDESLRTVSDLTQEILADVQLGEDSDGDDNAEDDSSSRPKNPRQPTATGVDDKETPPKNETTLQYFRRLLRELQKA
jgi:hypothetical protein